jgi:hypothetical protein
MARTIKGRDKKGRPTKGQKTHSPQERKKSEYMLVLCLFVFLFVPTTGPENMMNSWGQPKKKGQNWSTTHVSVFGKQNQRLNMGIMNDSPLDTIDQWVAFSSV